MSKRQIIVDLETTGLSPRRDSIHGIGILENEDQGSYYPIWDIPSEVLELLADPTVEKIGHNFRFDIKFLKNKGIKLAGKWYCTRVLAHALDENNSTSL